MRLGCYPRYHPRAPGIVLFPDVRRCGILLFVPILLSLVGSLHRGEAGNTILPPISEIEDAGKLRFHARVAEINRILRKHPSEAIVLLQNASQQAKLEGQLKYQGIFLSNLGACYFHIFQYPEALAAFIEARDLSERAGDHRTLASTNTNISSIYLQMNNLDAARTAAERGLAALNRSGQLESRPKFLIQLARVLAKKGQATQAEDLFQQGIAEAERFEDWETVALGWDCLGDQYRIQKRLPEADSALTKAFRLRSFRHLPEIVSSYGNLARLRVDQGDLYSAGILMNQAVAGLETSRSLVSIWSVYYERGRVRLLQGDTRAALEDFRTALQFVQDWRLAVIPTDDNRVTSETGLQRVYSALIEAGNRLYLETRQASVARETFEAAEENRAASLRALLPQPDDWRKKLPPQYWDLLPQLQSAQRAYLQNNQPELGRKVQQLRATLNEMEFSAGVKTGTTAGSALDGARGMLDEGSALLSFHLGDSQSWLWAVTRGEFALYPLPGRKQLKADIGQFIQALRSGAPDAAVRGENLHRELFGSLGASFQSRIRWLVSLDEELFPLPFSALVVEIRNGTPVYLAETHEIQVTSGAMMLHAKAPATDSSGIFVGVGDPIYNTADPRWRGPKLLQTGETGQFARLPGTRQELQACARAWARGKDESVLLNGGDATKTRLRQTLRVHPAVLHFATHVVQEQESGAIALGLNSSGEAEYLETAEITPMSLKAGLIVMSGCSSGKAQARPGTGLMGLTRAWIGAGAEAVLVTHWATPDDASPFLVSFYKRLREAPGEGPAGALRHARLEMLRSGTYRAKPEYWAAYFLVGNS